jgi:hypothetical protein
MSREQIYKSHLRMELESLDASIRSMVRSHTYTPDFSVLLHKLLNDEQAFWSHYSTVITVSVEWMRWLHQTLGGSALTMLSHELQRKIWVNFLRRLSLDPWLITDRDKSHGLELVEVMIRVIEDTLYTQHPIVPLTNTHTIPDLFTMPPLQPQVQEEPRHRYGYDDRREDVEEREEPRHHERHEDSDSSETSDIHHTRTGYHNVYLPKKPHASAQAQPTQGPDGGGLAIQLHRSSGKGHGRRRSRSTSRRDKRPDDDDDESDDE